MMIETKDASLDVTFIHSPQEQPEFDTVPSYKPTISRLPGKPYSTPALTVPVEGSGAPPPTPVAYEFLQDHCDLCFSIEDDEPLETRHFSSARGHLYSMRTSNPSMHINPPSYVVHHNTGSVTRKTWGVPML